MKRWDENIIIQWRKVLKSFSGSKLIIRSNKADVKELKGPVNESKGPVIKFLPVKTSRKFKWNNVCTGLGSRILCDRR